MKTKINISKAIIAFAMVSCNWVFSQNNNPDFKSPCGMTSAHFVWPDVYPQGYNNIDFFLTINEESQYHHLF